MTSQIEIVPYDVTWPEQFTVVGRALRQFFGTKAQRIDHIGSTAVPGLPAKDIIDVQVTVPSLADETLQQLLEEGPYQYRPDIVHDCFVDLEDNSAELRKRYMKEIPRARRVNIHIREQGRFNQRYALLFRDYLRASAATRRAYATIKRELATRYPDSIDDYLAIKDPVMDLTYVAAERWAALTDWTPAEDGL